MLPLGAAAIFMALLGVWASSKAAKFSGLQDPQFVVIDEVSGQLLTYVVALAPLNWKYLLLGFILFRVFDIWKPFPARQAESLPGGWGIMADDWIAGIYAGLGSMDRKSVRPLSTPTFAHVLSSRVRRGGRGICSLFISCSMRTLAAAPGFVFVAAAFRPAI